MNKYKLITIIGNIGVGKSTLTDLLGKALSAAKVPADSLFKVNPFFPLTLNDRARWSLTSDLWFLYERVRAETEIPQLLKTAYVMVDSGLPMSWVYAHSRVGSGYFTRDEWELYKSIHDMLIQKVVFPDIVIYLKASVEFLVKRIRERGREFELRYYTAEYLENLTAGLNLVIKKLKRHGVRVITVNAMKQDFVGDVLQLQKLVKQIIE